MNGLDAFVFGIRNWLQDGKEDAVKKLVKTAFEKSDVSEFTAEDGVKFTTDIMALIKPECTEDAQLKSILEQRVNVMCM
jgi:hypothetical protein